MNWRASEGIDISVLEYLTRRIRICWIQFCLDVIWKVILKSGAMGDTKLNLADLNSPRRELFIRSLKFVVTLAVPRKINFSCASTRERIQLYLVCPICIHTLSV